MHFSILDWGIVVVFLCFLIGMLVYSNTYMKGVTDFLVAGRSTGRYMLTMASGMVWIGAINILAMFEIYLQSGFVTVWWTFLNAPCALILMFTGFGIYRFRQSKALTIAQYLETRYSRNVRVFAGIISWVAGMINFGIFPAVGARFFMYFCGFPEYFNIAGFDVSTFPVVMLVLVGTSLIFVFAGGQIAVTVTDCLQGMFTQIAGVVIVLVLFFTIFDWSKILEVLSTAEKGKSMINFMDASQTSSFDMWFFLIGIIGMWYTAMSNVQAQSYVASAKSAHESRMGGVLNILRWCCICLVFLIITLCSMLILKHPDYTSQAAEINSTLNSLEASTSVAVRRQMTIPVTLPYILPKGVMGLFCGIMIAALISTYDSFMHSWGTVFLQDVVMPFRKKPFAPKNHIYFLRLSIVGVSVIALLFSYFYTPQQNIVMYFALVNNIWLGGAGAVILGGLYWKRGTKAAAYSSLILGTLIGSGFMAMRFIYDYNGWECPLNGQWMFFINIITCVTVYILVSLTNRENFNLNKSLHRDNKKQLNKEADQITGGVALWQRLFGITTEFEYKDRITMYIIVGWFAIWLIAFLILTSLGVLGLLSNSFWGSFWFVYIIILAVMSVAVMCWFSIGSVIDLRFFFKSLKTQRTDYSDDGFVRHDPNDDGLEPYNPKDDKIENNSNAVTEEITAT